MSTGDPVDLRSDTLTRPTPAMRAIMAQAAVGDDVWGEDPTARALEERVADVLGKQAALFVPSGTMANQIALQLHTRPGDEVIVGRGAHVRLYESGAAAALAGLQFAEVGESGLFGVADMEAAIQPKEHWAPRTSLVSVEDTHNRGGGRVWPIDQLHAVTQRARAHGLATHLDGARIWNAAVASGLDERSIAASFDTVAACFSKGLGAPVGSVVAGARELIDEARRVRKRLGGGMRQVGILCAAAHHALEHHRPLLANDHRRARVLAEALAGCERARIELASVETNIVIFEVVGASAREVCDALDKRGVRVAPVGAHQIRAVTHLDVDDAALARAIAAMRAVLDGARTT